MGLPYRNDRRRAECVTVSPLGMSNSYAGGRLRPLPSQRIPMAYNEHFELVEALEPTVAQLLAEHRERRKPWYFHEFVPWEEGRSFVKEPWEESQATINERARTSLVLNLLTEDNLPYYHLVLERHLPDGSVWKEWNNP